MKPLPTHRPVTIDDVLPLRWSQEYPDRNMPERIAINQVAARVHRLHQQQLDLAAQLAELERRRNGG